MNTAITISLPQNVAAIINRLLQAGYEAFAVGGCIRDSILGRCPDDWDITTSASPLQVKQLFRRTIDTGIQHGTVTVMMDKKGYEVTTYRIDGEYKDSRHPSSVVFTTNLREDLKRRDFTINAMAYNPASGLIDAFGGMHDLENGIIRCVGNPTERFTEDALRMLRAVRFSAQLGFAIEENTSASICALARNLSHISRERIQTELTKLLMSNNPCHIYKVFDYGLADFIFPQLKPLLPVPESTKKMLSASPASSIVRWSAFLSVLTKAVTLPFPDHFCCNLSRTILQELRFDNYTIYTVSRIVYALGCPLPLDEPSLRYFIYQTGEDIFPLLLSLKEAAGCGELSRIQDSYQTILSRGDCLSIRSLAINGKDLIASGIKPGKMLGEILSMLLIEVLAEPEKNTRDYLLNQAVRLAK